MVKGRKKRTIYRGRLSRRRTRRRAQKEEEEEEVEAVVVVVVWATARDGQEGFEAEDPMENAEHRW